MNTLYVVAIYASLTLGCLVLLLAVYTLVSRRRSDERQARLAPIRLAFQVAVDEYMKGVRTLGETVELLESRPEVATGVLLARASSMPLQERKRLRAVFHRLNLVHKEMGELHGHHHARQAEAALRLGYIGNTKGLSELMDSLKDPDPLLRLAAAEGLAQSGLPEAVLPILHSIDNDHVSVKKATELLATIGSASIAPLCEFLSRAPGQDFAHFSPEMVVSAVDTLGLLGNSTSVHSVKRFVTHPSTEVKVSVAKALSRLANPEAQVALLHLSKDGHWEVRAQAMKGLSAFENSEHASATLKSALGDPAWWVRHNAAQALSAQGEHGVGVLMSVFKDSPDQFARDTAQYVLEQHSAHETNKQEVSNDH